MNHIGDFADMVFAQPADADTTIVPVNHTNKGQPPMTTIARYYEIRKQADSVRETSTQECSVVPGSNDGYFIQAFGLQYRFASIEDPKTIARLFKEIVSFGPIEC